MLQLCLLVSDYVLGSRESIHKVLLEMIFAIVMNVVVRVIQIKDVCCVSQLHLTHVHLIDL